MTMHPASLEAFTHDLMQADKTFRSKDMSALTEAELAQIHNIEQSKLDAGIAMHHAETDYGTVTFTVESPDGGDVWSTEILTVNRMPHVLMGRYRFGYEYDHDSGAWAANPDKPIAHVGGYPGLRRKSETAPHFHQPTDNARIKIARALGKAIAPSFASPDEALRNERELAAQAYERKAQQAERDAERALEHAMNYRAEAARIRQGADYDKRVA